MINTRKTARFLAVLGVAFIILEISTTSSMPLSEESLRLDSESSGDNNIPGELKDDDDLSDVSEKGSGDDFDKFEKESPDTSVQSNGFTEKQVDKLIQAQDLGAGEGEGSAENAIPEFKEENDGSGEVIEGNRNKESQDKTKPQKLVAQNPSSIQSAMPTQEEAPTIVTGGEASQTPAVQPAAQVFTDANGDTQPAQSYNYATSTNQPEGQYYNDAQPAAAAQAYTDSSAQATSAAQPAAQTYNDAAAQAPAQYYNDASAQATPATQPAAQTYNDASAQATSTAAQYYNDALAPAAPAAQPAIQAYSAPSQPEPQQPQAAYNGAEKIPQPIDVAMEETHPAAQAAIDTSKPASHPSLVFNDANGIPQSVDAATMATPPQTQYYNNPAQEAVQPPAANPPVSSYMADNTAASQQWDTTSTEAAQQPMQYVGQADVPPQPQANQALLNDGEKLRKVDFSDENKFRTVVCQNNQDVISCPEGKKIGIVDAHYGSMGMSSCQGQQSSFLPMQPCETPGAYETVKTNCDDMENCVLSANDGIFGDKCQSDRKYLDVTYKCDDEKAESAQPQQYVYPGAQPAAAAYAPSPYYQASPYGYQQPQPQQYNDEPEIAPPPPVKIPELMSTLVQLSKNRRRYGKQYDQPTCSSCNKCHQCYKSAQCSQCGLCQSKLCDQAISTLPLIPKNLRPLWEIWNERTADMNSMQMSALIFSPPHKSLHKTKGKKVATKRSHIKTAKRSHITKHKKTV